MAGVRRGFGWVAAGQLPAPAPREHAVASALGMVEMAPLRSGTAYFTWSIDPSPLGGARLGQDVAGVDGGLAHPLGCGRPAGDDDAPYVACSARR